MVGLLSPGGSVRRFWITAFVSALVGCNSDAPTRSVTVTDSLGISVITNSSPTWSEDEQWTVSADPLVSIGAIDGDPDYLLGRVWVSAWMPDGRIILGDETAHAVRVYSPTGVHVADVGREGEGPGEFGWIWTVSPYRGDSLYVYDYRRHEVSVFDPELEFARRFRHPVPQGNYWVRESMPDGRFLLYSPGRGRFEGGPGLQADTSLIISVDPDGFRADTIGAFQVTLVMVNADGRREQLLLQPYASIDARDGRVAWSEGSFLGYVEADQQGRVRRVVRIETNPIPVTDATIAEFKATYLAFLETEVPAGTLARIAASLEEAQYHHTLPQTSAIRVDERGNTWVSRYAYVPTLANQWEVFDSGGVWLGSVTTPDGLEVHEIAADRIIGTYKDDLGVTHVRVHRIEGTSR